MEYEMLFHASVWIILKGLFVTWYKSEKVIDYSWQVDKDSQILIFFTIDQKDAKQDVLIDILCQIGKVILTPRNTVNLLSLFCGYVWKQMGSNPFSLWPCRSVHLICKSFYNKIKGC